MKKITFCINTSRNERPYLELLLQSLLNGIDINIHEIIVFVDSDNQNTTEMLIAQKEIFPNLVIAKNKSNTPWGYQMNINWMFQHAKHNIVSLLQSDMIIGLRYDEAILHHLTDNMILSSTRIEPPLHTQFSNDVTYVQNYGLTPVEFDYDSFLSYSEQIKNPNKLTNYFFAPFTLYRKLWNDIGGHDTAFKYSREDSDILYRFCLKKYNMVQCWDAIVYHFTCTSSRGIDWWKNRQIQQTQLDRDAVELARFVQKWGTFKHPLSYSQVEVDILKNPSLLNNIVCKNPPYPINTLETI
jgi:Glycosyltransferases, probably involved in cell wall biogenesis